MDVFRLGPVYSSEYLPDIKIEGYSSMIFTERWPCGGDFELITPKIAETMALLPVDSLISHLESYDVHIVEDHTIELDENDRPVLKVTGQSLDTFFQHRHVEGKYTKKRKMRQKYSNTGALGVLLWQAFDNASGKDVTREEDVTWNTTDRIPNIAITESAADDGNNANRWLTQGSLDQQVRDLLTRGDLGIRMIRPHKGSQGVIITVTVNPLASRGQISRSPLTTDITALRFDIYDGTNKSNSVKFRTLSGDLDKVQYLFSKKNHKTAIEIITDVTVPDQYRNTTEKTFTGIRRRVGSIDFGQADLPEEPKRPRDPRKNATKAERENWRDAIDNWREDHDDWENKVYGHGSDPGLLQEFRDDAALEAQRLLKSTKILSMLSGDISPLAPYQYGTDYKLGDRVSLIGEYEDTETDMIVTEYIRSENEEGDHGYPGLTLP